MLQELLLIPHEVLGLPVLGLGWLLMGWALFSVILLVGELRRRGWSRETRDFLPVLLLVGAAIAFVLPLLEKTSQGGEPLGLPIRGYGVLLLTGVVSGVALAAYLGRRSGLDQETVFSVSFWLFVGGIIGGRVFFVVQYWPQFQRVTWRETIGEVLKFTEGGLVVYGALVGSLAGFLLFTRRYDAPARRLVDVLAPGMALGLALGRIGCLMNGCCYGGVCDASSPHLQFPIDSPPYVHQHRLGELHGIRLAEDDQGRCVIDRVAFDTVELAGSLQPPELPEGSVVKSIQLSPWYAWQAARSVAAFVGRTLEVETADNRTFQITIGPPKTQYGPLRRNELGFELRSSSGSWFEAAEIDAAGPAAASGLRAGDQLTRLRLPDVADLETAQAVMRYVNRQLAIETADGETYEWAIEQLPQRSLPVHPTQLYSAMNAFLLCLVLVAWFPFRRRDGEILALMLTLYPISRFVLEAIRTDEGGRFGTGLTISQIVSLAMLLAAAGLWVYLQRFPRLQRVAAATSE